MIRAKAIFHNRFRREHGAPFWGMVKNWAGAPSQYVSDKEKFFLEMYQNHAEPLYRYLVFRIFAVPRAEELLQELFLRFWQSVEKGTRIEQPRAFLYTIALNLVIDEKRKRRESSLDALLEEGKLPEPVGEGLLQVERNVTFREVMDRLKVLNEQERELVLMRYVDDLLPREIAQIRGTSANVISVQLHRAVQKLRAHVQ